MLCQNCGSEMAEGNKFCSVCGQAAIVAEGQVMQPKKHVKTKNKKKTGKVIGIISTILLIVLGIAGGIVGVTNNNLNNRKNELSASINDYEMEKYNKKIDAILETWAEFRMMDFASKKEVISEMEVLLEEASKDVAFLETCNDKFLKMDEKKAVYDLAKSFIDYKNALAECQKAISSKDAEGAEKAIKEAEVALETVIKDNNKIVSEKMEQYNDVDMTFAEKQETEAYNNGIATIEKLVAEDNYKDLEEQFNELDKIIYPFIKPERSLNIQVQQIDISEFPNIKLYVQIEDSITKEIPTNLEQTLFYIGKQDANGNYVKQVVSKVNQLNQMEALSINMVADVSGSMEGTYFRDAKEVMTNFVNSVQFNAGDKVELIAFSTGVYLERDFCSDASLLTNDITNLELDNMTSLYDALYTAVTRTASQSGAKCVMAFTDGYDNYSSCNMNDVVEVAKRYRVPIFIIGIGDVDTNAISYIASETGGAYYSINQIYSMEEIYKEIYRQQKEMFLIEFVDSSEMSLSNTSNIIVRYNSPKYGGESYESYIPNILINVETDAFFQDGPEAVVEAYMKAFDDAMTYSDFSYIEEYLLYDSPIYTSQAKYVLKDISEALDSYEIVDVNYTNSNECVVKTRETYYVQKEEGPLSLLTQECQYVVVFVNGKWQMKDFADRVHVLSKIEQ